MHSVFSNLMGNIDSSPHSCWRSFVMDHAI